MAKNNRSLTSKERKELNNPKPKEPKEEDKPKKSKKGAILFSVVCLGLVLVIAGVSTGIYIAVRDPRFEPRDRPVARIYLQIDNRREQIDIMLFPEYAPNAVANFIFLVETGFYNGTIISDVGGPVTTGEHAAHSGHGFMRFAGFVDPVHNRAQMSVDPAFHRNFPMLRDDRPNNRFAWNLRADSANTFRDSFREPFRLSLIQSTAWHNDLSRTAMQISGGNHASEILANRSVVAGTTRNYVGHAFGRVMDHSHGIVSEIVGMYREQDFRSGYSHHFFRHPVNVDGSARTVTIRRIRIYQQGEWRMSRNARIEDMQTRVTNVPTEATPNPGAWAETQPANWASR